MVVWSSIVVCVALLSAVGGWAGWVILRPADDPLAAPAFTLAEVVEGQVESTLSLNTAARWESQREGVNRAVGVVTSLNTAPGEEVGQAHTLFTVNLRPVVVAQGEVPAFRSIVSGDEGADVMQLQQMLADAGFYAGSVDGKFGTGTLVAVRAWQRAASVEETGVVELGDVIFIPHLPARVALDTDIVSRGVTVAGGEQVLMVLPAEPSFTIPVGDAQAAMMPQGTRVAISSPEGEEWEAFVTGWEGDNQTETITVSLSGADGSTICGEQCSQIPVAGETLLVSRVFSVEPVVGLLVPSSALVTAADGSLSVFDEAGSRVAVTLVGSAKGMSVVDGVSPGMLVRIPAAATR